MVVDASTVGTAPFTDAAVDSAKEDVAVAEGMEVTILRTVDVITWTGPPPGGGVPSGEAMVRRRRKQR